MAAAEPIEDMWDSWEDHVGWLVEQYESGESYRSIADKVDGLHWQQVRRRVKGAQDEQN